MLECNIPRFIFHILQIHQVYNYSQRFNLYLVKKHINISFFAHVQLTKTHVSRLDMVKQFALYNWVKKKKIYNFPNTQLYQRP